MGIYLYNKTKEEVVADIINHNTVLDSSVRANRVWTLEKCSDGKTVAVVYLLKSHNGMYGYKSISSAEAPYYYDCPARIIKKITHKDAHTNNWIYRVTLVKEREKKAKSFFNSLPINTQVILDNKLYHFFGMKGSMAVLSRINDKGRVCEMYRYRINRFENMEVA